MGRILVLGLLVLISCSEEKAAEPVTEAVTDPRNWELTDVEKAWVQEHKSGLTVASTELEGAFQTAPDGPVGFHADLARALGLFLDAPIRFKPVPFDSFFSHDGVVPEAVKTDPDLAYEPDVFKQADLAAFNLTSVAWRRKLMDFHPLYLTRVVLVTPRGKEITQLSELRNKKIAVIANTSHELYMRRMKTDLGLDFSIQSIPFEWNAFDFVRQGGADALVRDTSGVMVLLQRNRDFNVTLPLMPTEFAQWAVSKKSTVFGGILEKFLAKERATGEMSAFWEKAYGLPFESYQNLIGDDPPLQWSDSEQQVIAALAKTGLRVAVSAPINELESGGGTSGTTYNLLLEVAKRLEVPLKLKKVAAPDQVDLYADMLTPADWRKKLLSFVSVYPSKLVWIALKNGATKAAPGTKIAVLSHSSYEEWIKVQSIRNEDVVLTGSAEEALKMVLDRRAGLTVGDANIALGWLSRYPEITFFPADSTVQDLSWGVANDNSELQGVLVKVLEAMHRSGALASIWQANFQVPMSEYLDLISVEKTP